MKDERKKSSSHAAFAIIVIVLVLLPVFYVLSVGPATRLCADGYFPQSMLFWVYHPIVVAEHKSKWVTYAVESYIELWKRG
jgi:hypothetical protein